MEEPQGKKQEKGQGTGKGKEKGKKGGNDKGKGKVKKGGEGRGKGQKGNKGLNALEEEAPKDEEKYSVKVWEATA